MTYTLNIDHDNEPFLTSCESVDQPFDDEPGVRYVFSFPNGYEVSVVKFYGTYGFESDQWEMGLMKDGDLIWLPDSDFEDEIIGFLCDEEVNDILRNVQNYEEVN